MPSRTDLNALFVDILESENVYFQPPASIQLSYPCIIYSRDYIEATHADNAVYGTKHRYSVTVIYKNPDDPIPGKISKLPLCRFDRHFTADNLNHDIFNLYF